MPTTPASPGDMPRAEPHYPKFRLRACARCSQSKLKCNWLSDPGTAPCERCARTRSECVLPSIKPRGPRRGNSTRVGQLEQKIDGIMSLLTASQHIQQNSPPLARATQNGGSEIFQPVERARSEHDYEHSQARLAPSSSFGKHPTPSIPLPPLSRAPPLEHIEIVPGLKITYHEADQAFHEFRAVYSPNFPFVPLPPDITAYDLYRKQPFLFRTLVQVCLPQSPEIQTDVKRWFREYIAQHMIVQQEKKLEFLQAILIFVAWSDCGFYIESKATNLLQLAIALVSDLGLNRSPASLRIVPYSLVNEAALVMKGIKSRQNHTLEEMRAVLGCFYLVSMVSSLFRRMHHFPYTSYLNHCCEALLEVHEYESDTFLVVLVRVQRLLSRISAIFPSPEADSAASSVFYAPLHMTISTVRKEMEALVENLPAEVKSNFLLWPYFQGALIRVYEPVIYMRSAVSLNDSMEGARRTEGLWSCLQTIKDFFTALLAIPADLLGSLPIVATSYISFATVTASRIMFLEDSDWDVALARNSFDFAAVMHRLEEHFEAAERYEISQSLEGGGQSMGRKRRFVDDQHSMMSMYRDKLRWIRHWYKSKLPPSQDQDPRDAVLQAADSHQSDAMDVDAGVGFLSPPGDLDGAFWQALLNFDGSWGSADLV